MCTPLNHAPLAACGVSTCVETAAVATGVAVVSAATAAVETSRYRESWEILFIASFYHG